MYVEEVNDIEMWKECVKSPCPSTESSDAWYYGVAERIIKKSLYQDIDTIKSIISAYQESCPKTQSLMPIALISNGLKLLLNEILEKKPIPYEHITKILSVLPESNNGEILLDWFLGTKKWMLTIGWEHKDIGYFFSIFIDKIELAISENHLERNAITENALLFVNDLKNKRDSINQS